MILTFIRITCMNYREVIRSVCISFVFKENNVMQCKIHLLTVDIPLMFFVSSIMVAYGGFKSKVIIPQEQFQPPYERSLLGKTVHHG